MTSAIHSRGAASSTQGRTGIDRKCRQQLRCRIREPGLDFVRRSGIGRECLERDVPCTDLDADQLAIDVLRDDGVVAGNRRAWQIWRIQVRFHELQRRRETDAQHCAVGVVLSLEHEQGINIAAELVLDVRHMLPGKDKKAARHNGQMIGRLIGTFLVDRALFHEKKSALGRRLASRKMLRIGVEGSFGGSLVGSILKVLFSRYLLLAERLGEKVKFVHDDLKQFIASEKAAKRADLEKAGLGHLNAFRAKSDDVMSFREMVSILVHLRDLMDRDREAFMNSVNEGVAEVKDDFAALNRVTTAAGFNMEKLADREQRALMIQMNAHAYRALDEILKAIDVLFKDVTDDASIMTILEELGVDVGDLGKAHESIRNAIAPKMDGFKSKEEGLKKEQADVDAKEAAEKDAVREKAKKIMEGKPLR